MITFECAARLQETMKVRFEAIHRLAQLQVNKHQTTFNRRFTSFGIRDILEPKTHIELFRVDNSLRHDVNQARHNRKRRQRATSTPKIVRPWDKRDGCEQIGESANSSSDEEEISVVDDEPSPPKSKRRSPLDALMEMATKTFNPCDTNSADEKNGGFRAALGKPVAAKKRRKSRTAFTNQQIYELEKRFLYQKYLTPADRDEISASLRLSNAQVITWFQNRRAKLKRDLEELKNDITATEIIDTSKRQKYDDSGSDEEDDDVLSDNSANGERDGNAGETNDLASVET